MQTVTTVAALRQAVDGWRRSGQRIGFVPTMGNLHAGHHSLVALARRHADRVVASVFVNPTQFGPAEDFDRYPRTPQEDAEGLQRHGCDLLFLPPVAEMYPFGTGAAVRMQVPALAGVLCGATRPGHFDGVATVVARLLNMVQPDVAVFGAKDFQQLQLVRHLVRDLAFPVQVLAAETAREADGLAMSSRNRFLDAGQRQVAPAIHQALLAMREGFEQGQPLAALEAEAVARLTAAGLRVDYVEVRRGADLARPGPGERGGLRAFVAARLGATRLIDNLALSAGDGQPSGEN